MGAGEGEGEGENESVSESESGVTLRHTQITSQNPPLTPINSFNARRTSPPQSELRRASSSCWRGAGARWS